MPSVLNAKALSAAALFAVLTAGLPSHAQQAAKPAAPARPYQPVAFAAAPPVADSGFEGFRKQLADAAKRKDRAALGKLVVAKGFFWQTDQGDRADKTKSGISNLSKAVNLADKDGFGWDLLAGLADDPTAAPSPDNKAIVCAPADPSFDEKAFDAMLKATGTDVADWGYPLEDKLVVRSAARDDAPEIEKLGLHFVRIMPQDNAAPDQPMLRIVTPSGKTGFIAVDDLAPLGGDQLCYTKEGGSWKITGYVGNGQ